MGRVLLNKNSIGAVLLTTLCADWAGLGRSEEALVGAYFFGLFYKMLSEMVFRCISMGFACHRLHAGRLSYLTSRNMAFDNASMIVPSCSIADCFAIKIKLLPFYFYHFSSNHHSVYSINKNLFVE